MAHVGRKLFSISYVYLLTQRMEKEKQIMKHDISLSIFIYPKPNTVSMFFVFTKKHDANIKLVLLNWLSVSL